MSRQYCSASRAGQVKVPSDSSILHAFRPLLHGSRDIVPGSPPSGSPIRPCQGSWRAACHGAESAQQAELARSKALGTSESHAFMLRASGQQLHGGACAAPSDPAGALTGLHGHDAAEAAPDEHSVWKYVVRETKQHTQQAQVVLVKSEYARGVRRSLVASSGHARSLRSPGGCSGVLGQADARRLPGRGRSEEQRGAGREGVLRRAALPSSTMSRPARVRLEPDGGARQRPDTAAFCRTCSSAKVGMQRQNGSVPSRPRRCEGSRCTPCSWGSLESLTCRWLRGSAERRGKRLALANCGAALHRHGVAYAWRPGATEATARGGQGHAAGAGARATEVGAASRRTALVLAARAAAQCAQRRSPFATRLLR
jgi:hypothetical protein